MQESVDSKLTAEQVRHIAKLARLQLSDSAIEQYRTQLTAILGHIRKLQEVDVSQVEPMAHPTDMTNRLAADEVGPSLPIEQVLQNAPAIEDHYFAVPKVLADQEG